MWVGRTLGYDKCKVKNTLWVNVVRVPINEAHLLSGKVVGGTQQADLQEWPGR